MEVKRSQISGKGLFALAPISAKRKIGEFEGERISLAEGRRRARRHRQIAIVETCDGQAIDASRYGNESRYINHSCSPNTYMRLYRGHVEFYALCNIKPGEELTCDYGASHHNGRRRCRCGSTSCRGCL